jgi:hypothetical protein
MFFTPKPEGDIRLAITENTKVELPICDHTEYIKKTVMKHLTKKAEGATPIESIIFSDNVSFTGEGVFSGCEKLKNVVLPALITNIGDRFFEGCSSLEEVDILITDDGITREMREVVEGAGIELTIA